MVVKFASNASELVALPGYQIWNKCIQINCEKADSLANIARGTTDPGY